MKAAKNVSADFRKKYLDIPWRSIAGMRDKLIHGYFGADLGAVWDTAIKDLPRLKRMLTSILNKTNLK